MRGLASPRLGAVLIGGTLVLALLAYGAGARLSPSDHRYMVETLLKSQVRDALIGEPLLEVRLGITKNYNVLTERIRVQRATLESFANDPRLRTQVARSGLRTRLDAIERLVDEQDRAVEDFKRHFALWRDSVDYLLTLVTGLVEEAARGGYGPLAEDLNHLLRLVLIYNDNPTPALEGEIHAQLVAVAPQVRRVPPRLRASLDTAEEYTRILVTEHKAVAARIREILQLPIQSLQRDTLRAYQAWYDQYKAVVMRYQYALGGASVALALYLGYVLMQSLRIGRTLGASERHLRNVLDSLYAFVGITTPDGVLIEVNRAPLQLGGITREDVIGKPLEQTAWFSRLPDAAARIRSAIRRAARGEFVRYDEQVTMAAGPMWIDLAVAPLLNEQGEITCLVPSAVDISDRKRAEDAVRQHGERLKIFIDHAPAAIAMFDRQMRYLAVSRRWTDDYALGDRDIIGCSHYDVFPEIQDRWRDVHRRGLAGEVVRADSDLFERRDGTVQWVRWEVRPWRLSDGTVGGIVIFTEDITARKQAEDEIRRLNAELEQRVITRTAQLAAVNQELEAFSYSVSHDLRASLRALHGFSAALAEDCGTQLDSVCGGYVNRIQGASKKMGQLIDDMLQLSRITRADLNAVSLDLCVLAREVIDELRRREPERHVEIVIAPACPARGDPRLLAIALENLLGNAWKFTRLQPRPRIEFAMLTEQGETVYFVRDNGVGFDMAYADKLFKAFQRLHSGQEFEGTGIGLSIVKRIINRHGGRVWAQANTGQGATFYFTLNPISD